MEESAVDGTIDAARRQRIPPRSLTRDRNDKYEGAAENSGVFTVAGFGMTKAGARRGLDFVFLL